MWYNLELNTDWIAESQKKCYTVNTLNTHNFKKYAESNLTFGSAKLQIMIAEGSGIMRFSVWSITTYRICTFPPPAAPSTGGSWDSSPG